MRQLSKQDIVEYIRHAIDMESSLFAEQIIYQKFVDASEKNKPVLSLKPLPTRQYPTPTIDANFKTALLVGGSLFIIGGIIFAFVILSQSPQYIWMDSIFFIFAIPFFLYTHNKEKEYKQLSTRYTDAYNSRCKAIKSENDLASDRYRLNNSKWSESDKAGRNLLNERISYLQNELNEYYSPDVVFPKYRNLPALTSIYEYLTSGRCDELGGPNGAYNLYETEVRQNTVISQLNTIISNLEMIRQNQYVLYNEISNINKSTTQIVHELDSIRGYVISINEMTALNTFYNGVTASCASAMTFYRTL